MIATRELVCFVSVVFVAVWFVGVEPLPPRLDGMLAFGFIGCANESDEKRQKVSSRKQKKNDSLNK